MFTGVTLSSQLDNEKDAKRDRRVVHVLSSGTIVRAAPFHIVQTSLFDFTLIVRGVLTIDNSST